MAVIYKIKKMKKLSVIGIAVYAFLGLTACQHAPENSSNYTNTQHMQTNGAMGYAENYYTEELEHKVGDRVFFGLDRSDVSEIARVVLEGQAKFMKSNPELKFVIEGYCDERGTREYNIALGERRANSVRNYLISLGVDSDRLSTVSYGKERPAVLGSDEDAWKQNRRAVTVVR